MEATQVWNSLRLVDQLEVLGHDVGGRLTMTAHRALFRVQDRRAKMTLARRAADEGWRSEAVLEAVREAVPATTGAKRQHPVELLVRKIERAGRPLADAEGVAGIVEAEATPTELRAWAARLEHHALLCEGVAARVRRRLG